MSCPQPSASRLMLPELAVVKVPETLWNKEGKEKLVCEPSGEEVFAIMAAENL